MLYRRFPAILLAGVIATIVMDALNRLVALTGAIDTISLPLIGRVITAWFEGQFIFSSPAVVPQHAGDLWLGLLYHYSIGATFAGLYLALLRWRAPTWPGALAFGMSTSLVSLLVVFPSVGLGFFGSVVPGGRALITSLSNHLFYGLGLFAGATLATSRTMQGRAAESTSAVAGAHRNGS